MFYCFVGVALLGGSMCAEAFYRRDLSITLGMASIIVCAVTLALGASGERGTYYRADQGR